MEERIHTINNLYSDMNEITEHLMTIIQAAEEAQALIKERANANSEVKRHVVLNGSGNTGMWEEAVKHGYVKKRASGPGYIIPEGIEKTTFFTWLMENGYLYPKGKSTSSDAKESWPVWIKHLKDGYPASQCFQQFNKEILVSSGSSILYNEHRGKEKQLIWSDLTDGFYRSIRALTKQQSLEEKQADENEMRNTLIAIGQKVIQ